MMFSPQKEYIEAVLVLRNAQEFQVVLEGWKTHRDQLLIAVMNAPDDRVDMLRHRAAALSEILDSVSRIEDLKTQFEGNGQAKTSSESIGAG